MAILEKILDIQKNLEVPKSGYDERQEYYYYRAEDVATAVRNAMSERGVIHSTKIVEWREDNFYDTNGRNRPRVTFKAKVIFIDAEDGSEFSTEVIATGSDTGGDKATRKAQVQAFKIAAVDLFIITEESGKFDSDAYAEAEPVNVTENSGKSESLNDLTEYVRDAVSSEDSPWTGEMVGNLGRKIAEAEGVDTKAGAWRKSDKVMSKLVEKMKAGETE